jgi:hypothetical protein
MKKKGEIMKKLFTILALLAFLMVPAASMAMVQTSDADLAAITGQSGVDIEISSTNITLGLGTLTWGDYDGKPVGTAAPSAANAGFINTVIYPVPMHISIDGLNLSVDVDTNNIVSGKTAVVLGLTVGEIKLVDGIIGDIVLDGANGAVVDYAYANGYPGFTASYVSQTNAAATMANGGATTIGALNAKTLGVWGISGVTATITTPMTIAISAH